MVNLNDDIAFNSLTDADFFDSFSLPLSSSITLPNIPGTYDDSVAANIDSSAVELQFDFDEHDPAHNSLSKYVTVSQFDNIAKNFKCDTFSLLHLNIRSLNRHFDDLQLLLNNPSPKPLSVIGLTETWLSQDSSLPFSIDNYNFIFKNRQGRIGGGVALYILQSFRYSVLENISVSDNIIESLFIEI